LSSENYELERLRSRKQDLLLLLDGGEKQLKIAQSRNEERQMEENIMRLRVSQLKQMTSNVSDKVYDLEKYRLYLEAVSIFIVDFIINFLRESHIHCKINYLSFLVGT